MSRGIVQATIDQLSKIYPLTVIDSLRQLSSKLQKYYAQHTGHDPLETLYEDFKQHGDITQMNIEEKATLYSLAFGVTVKRATDLACPDAPERIKQNIYRIVRETKEKLGVKKAKDTFINGQQLHEICKMLLKQHDNKLNNISTNVVKNFMVDQVNSIFGADNWDIRIMNDQYIQMIQDKLKHMVQNGGDQMSFQQLQYNKMLEVQQKMKAQQAYLQSFCNSTGQKTNYQNQALKLATSQNLGMVVQAQVQTEDFNCGSFDWREDSD